MYKKFLSCTLFLILTMILFTTARTYAEGEKILFIPVDERPISFAQTVDVLKQAGCEMILPPKNYFDRFGNNESPEKILSWLEKNAPSADAVVISVDAILYGGLIPSRKHKFSEEVLNSRINRLKTLRKKNPHLKIYVLCSLMRTPHEGTEGSVEEPDYYAEYGADIFTATSLADKDETVGLTSGERTSMNNLMKKIPVAIFNDWYERRQKNLNDTKKIIDLTNEGVISYLIIGRDDHWPFSQTHRESRELSSYAQQKNLSATKFQMLSGIDEFGLLLLTRAVDDLRGNSPKVYVGYNKGLGADTIPIYSDETVDVAIKSDLAITGGKIVKNPKAADFVLLVNTDPEGNTYNSHNAFPYQRDENFDYNSPRDGTKYFVDMVERYVNEGYSVCVADITFANGADNPMMNLLKERDLLFKLQAYAGWNTANNSLGFVTGTGILTRYMTQEAKDKLLATRYLDDWAYQANVRTIVGDWIFNEFPNGEKFYSGFGGKNITIEERITELMREFAAKNLPPYEFLRDFKVSCPWNRMFEVDIKLSD